MVALQKYGLEFPRLVLVGLVMVGRLAMSSRSSPTPFPCRGAGRSPYGQSCTRCTILMPGGGRAVEFCNHGDHGLDFDDLVSFVSSKNRVRGSDFRLALEEDETIVSDAEYLQCLEAGTTLKLLYKESQVEADGMMDIAQSPLSELEEANRKILLESAAKLQRHLGSFVVLSQDELQVLYEADEEELQSLLRLPSLEKTEDFQALCLNLHMERAKRKETVDYLDLVKRAKEWEKGTNGEHTMTGGGDWDIEADGPSQLPQSGYDSSQDDQADGGGYLLAREGLLERLKARVAGDDKMVFTVLMGLSENDYRMLLADENEGLKALNLPSEAMADARRFCREQIEVRENERRLKGYFGPLMEQQAC